MIDGIVKEYGVRDYPPGAARLDLNESPYPPPREALEAMKEELGRVNRYPEARLISRALEALAGYTGVGPRYLALTGGGDYGLFTLISLYSRRLGRAIVPRYTFSMTTRIAEALGLRIARIPLYEAGRSWVIDEDALFEEARRGGIIIVDRPNNPTGSTLLGVERVVELAEEARGPIVVDEAYYEFSGETLAGYVESIPNIVVLRTMSKAFSLAGMRIGYIIAQPRLASTLRAVAPFSLSRPALAAVEVLASNSRYIREVVKRIVGEREWMRRGLEDLGLRTYESSTNYLLVDAGREGVAGRLQEHNIYVRETEISPSHIRISAGTRGDIERLLDALERILD